MKVNSFTQVAGCHTTRAWRSPLVAVVLMTVSLAHFQIAIGNETPEFDAQPATVTSTFNVDTVTDDPNLQTCSAAPNDCSLRGAIIKTNGLSGSDQINLTVPCGQQLCFYPTRVNIIYRTQATATAMTELSEVSMEDQVSEANPGDGLLTDSSPSEDTGSLLKATPLEAAP